MISNTKELPVVCVLLSAYNGAEYLEAQIESVLAQTGVNVFLDIRDDGSPEPAREIYEKYGSLPNVRIRYGENLRPAASFWKLLEDAGEYDYYAFCDQDDIWDSDKLISAVELMSREDQGQYLFYCGANRQIDGYGNPIQEDDPRFVHISAPPLEIEKVLMYRATAQGCTMVINHRLRERALQYRPDFSKIKGYHDRWLYRSNFVLGGKCIYDPVPHFSYRIHGGNASMQNKTVGKRKGLFGKIDGTVKRFCRSFYSSNAAEALYEAYRDEMAPEVLANVRLIAFYKVNPIYRLKCVFLKKWHPKRKLLGRLNVAFRFLVGKV